MIDIEIEVFNEIATKLRAEVSKITVYGEYVRTPAEFPCVIIEEKDNSVYERSQTGTQIENHADLMYEITCYSNLTVGKKSECKAIFKIIDTKMGELGFTRTSLNPISNINDATIYRMIGRYRAVVSNNNTIYRR